VLLMLRFDWLWCEIGLMLWLLHVFDLSVTANDVGKGCYGAMKVRDAFADAYRDLRDAVLPQYQLVQSGCSTFLGRILRIPRDIFQYRRLMTQRYTQVIQAPVEYPVIFDNLVMSPTQGLQTQAVNDDRYITSLMSLLMYCIWNRWIVCLTTDVIFDCYRCILVVV
jgi:hypothetical protein